MRHPIRAMTQSAPTRERFMKHETLMAVVAAAMSLGGASSGAQSSRDGRTAPLPECEWCGAPEAPTTLGATLSIPAAGESGERLIVEGTVYMPDGRTPAGGVLL
jgi:hypothetical protein